MRKKDVDIFSYIKNFLFSASENKVVIELKKEKDERSFINLSLFLEKLHKKINLNNISEWRNHIEIKISNKDSNECYYIELVDSSFNNSSDKTIQGSYSESKTSKTLKENLLDSPKKYLFFHEDDLFPIIKGPKKKLKL